MKDQKIGSYRIIRLLGEGGMGQVFEALHETIARRVAIKLLYRHLCRDEDLLGRFVKEALAANLIAHPGIVMVYEEGRTDEGQAYLILEYLDGETLRQRVQNRGGRIAIAELLPLCRQVASALSAAHEHGIVHRDLKPDNLMIIPDPEVSTGERIKILDFGIAKIAGHGQTEVGTVLGTLAYMSPEQCQGRPVADRADVYALGAMMYELLSGKVPYPARSIQELMQMHQAGHPSSLQDSVPTLHPEIADLIHKMLMERESQRPSMREVEKRLRSFSDPPLPGSLQGRTSAHFSGQSLHKESSIPWPLVVVMCAAALALVVFWQITRAPMHGTQSPMAPADLTSSIDLASDLEPPADLGGYLDLQTRQPTRTKHSSHKEINDDRIEKLRF